MLFRKCGCLVAYGKWIFRKRISVNRKIKAFDPKNIFSQNFTFKSFLETHKERKRERKDSHAQTERERDREPRKPKIAAPPVSRTANPRTRDRRTANPRTVSHIAPIALVSHTANPQTCEPVTDLVWNFCNKICLWFWFFNFFLWSQIFVVVVVVWVVGFWWFSSCVVVDFVWVVVENSVFRMLPNTWKYFLEKFS